VTRNLTALLMLLLAHGAEIGSASATELLMTDSDFGAGYVTLAWPGLGGESFILQEKGGTGWEALYKGTSTASTLTGLSNGDYTYRVISDAGRTTEPLDIRIHHHSLTRAFGFFGTGAVLLLILLAVIFVGVRSRNSTV